MGVTPSMVEVVRELETILQMTPEMYGIVLSKVLTMDP
jgi:hypothetical protein